MRWDFSGQKSLAIIRKLKPLILFGAKKSFILIHLLLRLGQYLRIGTTQTIALKVLEAEAVVLRDHGEGPGAEANTEE